MNIFRTRSTSLSMVVLVLLIILLLQSGITYGSEFGKLEQFSNGLRYPLLASSWLVFRFAILLVIFILWLLNRKRHLFRWIIFLNTILTFGLLLNMTVLGDVLLDISAQAIKTLLLGIVFMVINNILIFSIWYWIIDPPGVEDNPRDEEPWDFLFPQRMDVIPHYETWRPRYTDYLYLAFTTSFAFSPTDTMPLTRRAKLMMLLQSSVSIITLTAIAGGAINILAGSI